MGLGKVITAEITADPAPSGSRGEIQEAIQEAIQAMVRKWGYAAGLPSIEWASWKSGQTKSKHAGWTWYCWENQSLL